MNRYETLKLFDYSIFTSSLDEFENINIDGKCVINTLNQYSYIIAEQDETFKTVLMQSDMLLPDGIGIVGAAKILKGKKIKKIAGADMHKHLLKKLSASGGSCFYLGSSDETLEGIRKRLAVEYPAIRVGTHSPPFKNEFNDSDNAILTKKINAFLPDVLFVGMTAPKQEKWVYVNKDQIDTKVICSIGAVFDFYSGTVKRPGKFWINLGLEWFIRLVNEPNHLWRRYLLYGPVFVYLVFKEKLILLSNRKRYIDEAH
ncbi:WecB/TagA/CpsF family glycosyltransferase [Mucilaginibacter glaciei]|uniref:WecB/TagA/CpsF family glycosyltransferase n=1 Tax=Mucilaginibacter glaciei TaxID=2772109 RepID=A0A926S0U7_9SPHI|nr:WecB/TagA/CpsF family glycosyltransferase [Mucilaginibacter glaciei]MBD1393340.1 WecB/TagA/CpsF family glycosyltransferase [Mucilaginibacter glaciei]